MINILTNLKHQQKSLKSLSWANMLDFGPFFMDVYQYFLVSSYQPKIQGGD